MAHHFIFGAHYLLRGLMVFKKKGLRRYVYMPLLCNVLIFGGLYCWGLSQLSDWVVWIQNWEMLPDWLLSLDFMVWVWQILKWILVIIFSLLMLFVFGTLASILANLIATPFNGLLSEKTHLLLYHQKMSSPPLLQMIFRNILREFKKLMYYLPRALGVLVICLALYFIPVVNVLVPFVLYAFGAWIMAIQYLDYPADNAQLSIPDMISIMRKNRLRCFGFGAAILGISVLPGVNFVIMPVSVVGATILWHDMHNSLKEKAC